MVFCIAVASTSPAFAQERPRLSSAGEYEAAQLAAIVTAVRTTDNITINGLLDEPSWERAAPAGNFIQRRPRTGEPTTERTEVRFLYDDDNLYVGVICFDSQADRIVANSLQKDYQTNESDGITILIDSLRDRRSGFTFVANPAGAKRDVQLSNNGSGFFPRSATSSSRTAARLALARAPRAGAAARTSCRSSAAASA